jgi:uncharacterized protein with HEPN domain
MSRRGDAELAQDIAGMRDRLIHGYFGVNRKIVRRVATEESPKLEAALAP